MINDFKKHLEKLKTEFPQKLQEFKNNILESPPLLLLSYLHNSKYIQRFSNAKEYNPEKDVPSLSFLEIIQAVSLQYPLSEFKNNEKLAFDKILSKAEELGRIFSFKNLKLEEEEKSSSLLESIKLHTQLVRGWGYPKQVINYSKKIWERINTQKLLGYELKDIIVPLIKGIIKKIEEKNEKYNQDFKELNKRKKKKWRCFSIGILKFYL